ncbi:IPT/TIG domain-containing protein [Trichlorobacter lovleyi]|uniref:IPT/TIG domain-containing protein n=1 Tax=Trichlorobacter lovleyi TaxID=313985 RepID=UPI00224077C7|nr:IPT/TIG domain-containing protein [Trichlorobacter lovleyi]QOX78504.1 IPT/TIG domain-containing protein [Trichlorobacter lovleyi]
MKKFSLLLTTVLTVLLSITVVCQAATITGTITNSTGKTKRIFITAFSNNGGSDNGYGVSIDPAQTLTYTINGVAAYSSYTVHAFMDTQDMGYPHANDPRASVTTVTYETTGTADFTLTNPTYVPPVSPSNMEVIAYPGSNGNMLLWNGAQDNATSLTIADYYVISTNSSASDSGATLHTVKAGDRAMFFHAGGTASTYYKVTAYVGTTPAPSTVWIQPTPRTGGATVSGSVALSGVTPTGPLAVVLVSYAGAIPQFYVAVVPSPTASNSYSFSNIPAGTYNFFTFIDMNNDGTFSAGDLSYQPDEYSTPTVTVPASGTVSGPTGITITSQNAFRLVNTSHNKNSYGESLGVGFKVEGQLKRPVNVKVSGPGIADNTDVGLTQWGEFKLWPWSLTSLPAIGNTYTFAIYYADGSSDTGLTASISTILNSFPTPVTPEGYIAYTPAPTFSWTAPSSPPSPYSYNLWLNGNTDGLNWNPDDFPSTQTSVLFNADGNASATSLTANTTYYWGLSVMDRYGNSAQYQATFIPTNKPAITGFTPASALGGQQITLKGVNFSTSGVNTVTFSGGVSTSAVASSSTSLTITVPSSGVMNGSITVSNAAGTSDLSSMSFNLVQAIAVTGMVTNAQGTAVSSALVELEGNPAVAVSTAANGSFTLTGLPGSNIPFRLKISKAGYLPVYAPLSLSSSMDLSGFPYTLFSTADLPGLLPTYGIILATIRNMNDLTPVSGATATALPGGSVLYYDSGLQTFTGTATDASGLIAVPNVEQSTLITLQPTKTGWTFYSQSVQVPSSSVVEMALFGTPPPAPQVTNISPLSAAIGSTVTISGAYFNDSYATNTVTFNGNPATITGGNSTTLYVTVPPGATTGNVCVTAAGGGPICYSSPFTPLYPLTLSLTGTGSGAVNATAGTTLSCNSGLSCPSVDVAYNTEVTLHEQPNLGSNFASWTGCTPQTDASYCKLTITGNSSVSAAFTLQQNLRKGTDPSYTYYGTLKSALTSAVSGDVILARMMLLPDLTNDATFDSTTTTVTLRGGYTDSGFSTRLPTDFTSVTYPLTIKNGTLVLDQIIIK